MQDAPEVMSKVEETLRKHPEGLTILRLAELVGVHRHTVTKYVYMMIGSGEIYQRDVGRAKLCYLKERLQEDVKGGEMLRRIKDEAAAASGEVS